MLLHTHSLARISMIVDYLYEMVGENRMGDATGALEAYGAK